MYYLTTKQRSGLIFGSVVFFFTLFIFLAVFIILQFVLTLQIRNDLTRESVEVMTDWIGVKDGNLIYQNNDNGKALRSHIIADGLSSVLFDNKENALKKIGIFESAVLSDKRDDLSELRKLAFQSKSSSRFKETNVIWNKEKFSLIITPIKYKSKSLGTLIIAKSTSSNQKIIYTMAGVFLSFSIVTLLISFALGYVLAEKNLQPLKKIILAAEEIDLDKLDKSITVPGSNKDEIVILAKKFNEMLARLRIMAERQKDFISNASHELKTPLTRAISSLDVLMSSDNFNNGELILIKNDLIGMNDLLEKLLFLSKIRSNSKIKKEKVNVQSIFRKVIRKLSTEIKRKEISLSENYQEDLEILIDKPYLEIVLINLLSNAIKYSPAGSEIQIEVFKDFDRSVIEIADRGMGMDQEEVKRIFSRFFRSGEARAKEHGHGIGLAIVKEICDLYNIDITIESSKNKGTKVTLRQNI